KEGEYKEELIEYNGKIYKKFKYTIKKGDTLWDISAKFLDDAFRWPFLHNINKYIIDPDVIEPGDPLTIYVENKS
ncbi:MAG TPA: LysM peptidoglycan-binding domain-containing protein, partial [Spirochaetota bacterium]|nr:LysM peptidoglycan-binding domain-containing protein [Spirochaetota bacterium]